MKAKKLLALTLALILALSCMSITAFAENATYLDLEEGDEYLDTKTGIEQKYTATVTTNKTDKTKVEVSWKLENIAVSVTNNKVWDTETLTWVDDTANPNTATASNVTAEFDFVNRSSINIDAQVTFEVASGFTAVTPTFTDNGVTEKADGIITLGTKADGEDTDNDGEIKATISPVDADFATLTENKTEQNYGTYTVTIRKQAPAKTVCATFADNSTMTWEELKAKYNVTDTSIGERAFYEAELVSITIPNSVTSIGKQAFAQCTYLEEVEILDGVTSIGEHAFEGCTSLVTITIPNSVTSIGFSAFYRCSNLTIDCSAFTSQPAGWNSGWNIYNCEVIWGKKDTVGFATFANNTTLSWDELKAKYNVTDTSIGDEAFAGTNIVSIIIPDGITSIGMGAFVNCASLKEITIPNSVTSIGEGAFVNCSSLKEITIPNSVTSIGDCAFAGTSIESITIPNSVTSMGLGAFAECKSLKEITIPNSVTSIGMSVFRNCTSLKTITIPNSVTSIGENAFGYCTSLATITIPDSVESIGESAFRNCTSLKEITIPNSVTSISRCAFEDCSNLTINCSATSQPNGWDSDWNPEDCKVNWGVN